MFLHIKWVEWCIPDFLKIKLNNSGPPVTLSSLLKGVA